MAVVSQDEYANIRICVVLRAQNIHDLRQCHNFHTKNCELQYKCPIPGLGGRRYGHFLLITVGFLLLSWVVTLLSAALMGLLIDLAGRPMMWFTNVKLLAFMYAAPALAVMVAVNALARIKAYSHVI